MRRVLSVYLPHWPIERITRRRPPGDRGPLLLVRVQSQREIVAHACPASLGAGVRAGMSLAHARALLASSRVTTAPEDPRGDLAGLEALARWATRWSPVARADPPDGLALDITGCAHLFGGERGLIDRALGGLARLGLTARGAIASALGAAWGVARHGPGSAVIIPPGAESEALDGLPVAALRADPRARQALAEVGVVRAGQLLALPRDALPARYGEELVRRIDQALGRSAEHIPPVPDEPEHRVTLDLPGGATQWEAIAGAVRILLADLAGGLGRLERGLRRLDARFQRIDAHVATITIRVSRPSRCPKHLWRLLEPKVERLHLGFGVESITLIASGVGRLAQRQGTLTPPPPALDDRALAEALDAIASRLGPARVMRAVLVASHKPERAAHFAPADRVPAGSAQAPPSDGRPRPTRLYEPPRAARVMALSPDGPVMTLSWHGGEHAIVRCLGPERLSGEWWRGREPARDYFRVQGDGGRWLWLFRESTGAWYVHGEWC